MNEKLIAAYDFGTSGCKLALIDFFGAVRASASSSYCFETPHLGWAEQDPTVYWDALCKVTPAALAYGGLSKDCICAAVFATIWKGIIPVDRNGQPLRNNILWLDGRAKKEAAELNEKLGIDILSHKDYWPKLLWYLRNEPKKYENTHIIFDVNSYLCFLLTGEAAVSSANHFTKSEDPISQQAYDRFFKVSEIEKKLFPLMVSPSDEIGRITQQASAMTGLPEGIPVFAGCTDVMAIPVGVGASVVGSSHVYLGTSGWFGQITPISKRKSCFLASPYTPASDVTIYGLNAACTAIDWAIARFYPQELAEMGMEIYSFLEKDLAKVPAGSDGLIATTWLYNERPPVYEKARGLYLNISCHHERQHFVNAMRESVAYMLRWKKELMEQVSGIQSSTIRVAGGGARSSHWMQILANVLNIPVEITAAPQYAGALGAASCALIGLKELSSFEDMGKVIHASKCFWPDEQNEIYNNFYDAYRELPVLNGIFDKLNKGMNEKI
ncbi:MAG: xylulokinase [Lutisporaceae bacterium]|jgi:xylulokinase